MADPTERPRSSFFDYAASVDPAVSAFGWRYITLSYLAVLLPLTGIVLPRDGDTHTGIVAVVLAVALATVALNAVYLRRMLASEGWEEPPGEVVLGQAVVVTIATGALNYALSGAGGFYRPIIVIPTILVAVIGNRAMFLVTSATAFVTLMVSTWAQGTDPAHLPAFAVSHGATWGLLLVMIRLLARSALEASTHTQGIADAAAIAARTDRLEDGIERLLPVIGSWALAHRVTAHAHLGREVVVLDQWPPGNSPAPPPARPLVERARGDDGATVDGPVALLVADLAGDVGPEITVTVTVEGPNRPRLDQITYHFQLTRMAAQIATLLTRTRHIERLERLGHTDALTGLPNRRALEDRLDEARALARPREALTLVMIDLDDFKAYNDTHGHPAGDDLLRRFAEALRVSVRGTDFVARYGGEEFCVLLPATSSEGARSLLDHLRIFLRSGTLNERVAFSAGIATWDGTESTPDLIDRADQALYAAKRAGKDRSEIA